MLKQSDCLQLVAKQNKIFPNEAGTFHILGMAYSHLS